MYEIEKRNFDLADKWKRLIKANVPHLSYQVTITSHPFDNLNMASAAFENNRCNGILAVSKFLDQTKKLEQIMWIRLPLSESQSDHPLPLHRFRYLESKLKRKV